MRSSLLRPRVSWCLDPQTAPPQPSVLSKTTEEEDHHPSGPPPEEPAAELGPDFVLPRSSPVISRKHSPLTWNRDDQLSPTSPSPFRVDQCGALKSTEDRRPASVCQQEDGTTATEHRRSPSVCPNIPAEVFRSTCELEQENVHFILVDLVLEVLEGAKWRLSFDECLSLDSEMDQEPDFTASSQRDSSLEEHTPHDNGDGDGEEGYSGQELKTFSVLSTDSGFEDWVKVSTPSQGDSTQRDSATNAEVLAQRLVQDFRRSWCASEDLQRGRSSLRTSLRQLPGGETVVGSDLKNQIRLRTRMRGTFTWTPPTSTIVLTTHTHHRRSDVVASQQFLCAGCGTELEPRHIKKLRYCEYLGKYFCDCCHSGAEAVIPARVLSSWDFSRYPVSDFSKQLLDCVWAEPLFDLNSGPSLRHSKERQRFRELQTQLVGVKRLLRRCRFSERVLKQFDSLPGHMTRQPLVFSLDDLYKLKKGVFVSEAKTLLQSALHHVQHCQLCLSQGCICEFCKDRNIIFPFQSNICKRCPGCKKYFHKYCFVNQKCPVCAGFRSKRNHQEGSRKCVS